MGARRLISAANSQLIEMKSRAQKYSHWPKVLKVLQHLQDSGHTAYFAGGAVRDLLLNREPQDFDIATDATPERVEALFSKTIPVGKEFGVMIVQEEGLGVEVATFRHDGPYRDGRRPESISFSNEREDALRRDFTINALFWDPIAGKLIDHVGGWADLQTRTLKTVGSPHARFAEDKLRMLRAIRFVAQLGFSIQAETLGAIQSLATEIRLVSVERIRHELEKLWRAKGVSEGLRLLEESGLRREILPDWQWCTSKTLFSRALAIMAQTSPELKVRLFALSCAQLEFDPAGKGMSFIKSLEAFRFSKELLRGLALWISQLKSLQKASWRLGPQLSLAEAKEILAGPQGLSFLEVIQLWRGESRGEFDAFLGQMLPFRPGESLPLPWFGGEDLKKVGMAPGPQMGDMLQELWKGQLENRWSGRAQAEEWLRAQTSRCK